MCGINGIINGNQSLIHRMNETIAHRGPDGEGDYINGIAALGHRRL
jgi:asparagine synthase (glutamine-hydrolysing)